MDYLIAVFKVRSITYDFYNSLIAKGIKCSIVDTPKIQQSGCGISVRFNRKDLPTIQLILANFRRSFVGFYKTNNIVIK